MFFDSPSAYINTTTKNTTEYRQVGMGYVDKTM